MAGFITLKELVKQINASDSQMQLYSELLSYSSGKNNYSSLYDSSSLLWIFAFLEVLESCLAKTGEPDYGKCGEMNDFYIRIGEFIIESPDLLTDFPQAQQQKMLSTTRYKLAWAKARAEAFRWMTDRKEEHFLVDFITKIKFVGGRVIDFDNKVKIIVYFLYYSPLILTSLTNKFLELFQLPFWEKRVELSVWALALKRRIAWEAGLLEPVMFYGELTSDVREKGMNLIRLLAALCLLDAGCDHRFKFMLCRYLVVLTTCHSEFIRARAVDLLATKDYVLPEYSWEDLIIFNPELFAEKVFFPLGDNQKLNDIEGIFEGEGRIVFSDSRFSVQPFRRRFDTGRISNFMTCLNGTIEIKSHYKPKAGSNDWTDFSVLTNHWEAVLEDYRSSLLVDNVVVGKERPGVGTRLKIRIKNFAPSMPLLAFAEIVDDQYTGVGIIHTSQMSRIRIGSAAEVFAVGDVLTVVVIEATEEKLAFSLLEPIGEILGSRCYVGEVTAAILVARKGDDLLIWCTEKGFPVYTPVVSSLDLQVGETYLLKFIRVYPNGFIKARILEPVSEVRIDPQRAVREFLRDYVEPGEEGEPGWMDPADILKPEFVRDLLALLDLEICSNRRSVERFHLLYCARLISYIAGETVLEEYFVCCLDYMREIYRFTLGYEIDPDILSDNRVEKYPRLSEYRDILTVCAARKPEYLLTFLNSKYEKASTLARLLLGRNLLSDYPRLKEEVNTEILKQLSFYEDQSGDTQNSNFGRETGCKEFKSSAIFPPESNFTADIGKQSNTILAAICGFLNARGGTLYIGVNDAGFPQGIEMDLQYLHGDEDKYELFLRREIIKHLGKDINSQVMIDFQEYSGKIICVISVPVYHDVVSLNGTVWQRQGNSTISLDDEAIRLLRQRKNRENISDPSLRTPQSGEVLQKISLSANLPPIPFSKLRKEKEEKPLAYFSILQTGKYVMTTDLPVRNDLRLTLPLYPGDQYGFLVQIYASGCVNRVLVNMLLGKKRNYEYANAFSNSSEIVFIDVASPDDYIFMQTRFKESEYIRIQSLARIKINQDLSLKGTPLVMIPFDRIVRTDILKPSQVRKLKKIETEDTKTLGALVSSLSVAEEAEFLEELFRSAAAE